VRKLAVTVGAGVALALTGLAVAAVSADTYSYRTTLSTGAEVPKPKAPANAGGAFTATVTTGAGTPSIKWALTFRNLSGKAVAAHVHRGVKGVAGGVILPLCSPCKNGQSGRTTITKGTASAFERGAAYVNVHTAKNAAGEIRGQVKLVARTPQPQPQPQPEPPYPSPDDTVPY
jgi:hypothetical protein